MVIVKLQGGLGNQMFQYAAGRRLAVVNNTSLKLDISAMAIKQLRSYNLDQFNIQEKFASQWELLFVHKFMSGRVRILKSVPELKPFLDKYSPWEVIQEDHVYKLNSTVLEAKGHVYLDGYWQSEKYFIDIQDTIRKDFSFRSLSKKCEPEITNRIVNTKSVGLHIRRGDYVSNSQVNQIHGTCEPSYYQQSIDLIAKEISAPHFFIFSDDPSWCEQNLHLEYPVTVVSQNYSNSDLEDLRLMSLCQHQIIANSTFSWWAAWLNANPEKIVIAPQQWFRERSVPSDLLPDSWIKI